MLIKKAFKLGINFVLLILINSAPLNAQITSGTLPVPQFSSEHGFYENSFDVIVSAETPNASIKYTLDGSDPRHSESAIVQSSPAAINIDPESTSGGRGKTPGVTLRACTLVADDTVSESVTQTYIFIEQVKKQKYPGGNWPIGPVNSKILDYEMDSVVINDLRYKNLIEEALLEIPAICISTDLKNLFDPEIGIYVNPTGRGIDWERPISIELIDSKNNEPGFQINAGLRIRGGYSRIPTGEWGQYKHAFRFFFRNEYGNGKLNYPLFGDEGVSEFDAVDLRTAQNYSWSYQGYSSHVCIFVRELFSRDCQRDMGQPYTRSREYHLYINGMYWGLYQTQERSEASYAESYFGGDKNNYDVVKVDPERGIIEATDGTLDAYNQLWSYANAGFSSNEAYFKVLGKNQDGSDNFDYPILCNVDNLIDYLLIIYYTGNFDSPVTAFGGNSRPNNFYGIYNRSGRSGFLFFSHDAEHSLMDPQYSENSDYGLDRTGPYSAGNQMTDFNPQWLHQKLSTNIEYRIKFSDHIYRHFFNNGVLTNQKSQQRLTARTTEIDTAVIAESARWGDAKTGDNPPRTKDDDWTPAVSWIMNSFFPTRTNVVLQQLKNDNLYPNIDPPEFINNGQEINSRSLEVEPGYILKIQNPNSTNGSILFTLDSNDPRIIGGETSGSAQDGGDEIEFPINSTTVIKARIKNGAAWSALHEIILFTGEETSNLKITEIHYHPLDSIAAGDTINDNEYEFLELKNIGTAPINLSQAFFTDGITYNFPEGTTIESNNFIVLASNRQEFNSRYGYMPFGDFSGQLNNGGETITLVTSTGDTIFSVTYSDQAPWPALPDGNGNSLVPTEINPSGNLNDPASWRASYAIHGSPGRDDLLTSAENPQEEIPESFALYQNYPNPFNPSTEIIYALRNHSRVYLSVFDLLGREVSVLVNTLQKSGRHKVLFSGANLSSGIYFYRLRTADGMITKKMILMK